MLVLTMGTISEYRQFGQFPSQRTQVHVVSSFDAHMLAHGLPDPDGPGTIWRRADLLLTLHSHVILDGFHTLDATRHFNRLVNVGPRTDEAA